MPSLGYRVGFNREVNSSAVSWLFSSRRQAHFLLEYSTGVFQRPNVRAKPAVRSTGLHTDREPCTVAVCEAVLGSVADSVFGAPCLGMAAWS